MLLEMLLLNELEAVSYTHLTLPTKRRLLQSSAEENCLKMRMAIM